MESSLSAQIFDLWEQALLQGRLLLLPTRLYQVGILVGCILLAWLLKRWIEPKFTGWLHTLEGRPKWQLRLLVMIRQRLGLIIFAILVSIAAQAMAEWSPFPWMVAFPVELVIGKLDKQQTIEGLGMQALWLAISFVVLHLVWRLGAKRYSAVGA